MKIPSNLLPKNCSSRCSKNPINADPKAYIDEIVESFAGPRWVVHNGASARHDFFFGAQKKSLKRHDFV